MKTVDFTGTVSEGTMREFDLVPCFLHVLREYNPDAHEAISEQIPAEAWFNDGDPFWQSDECVYILNEDIWDAMAEIAPEGYYFGSHPGDGSDYGYWQCEDYDEEEE